MDSSAIAVFDLSPWEKLQLVEDLWDDLASTPEAAGLKRLRENPLRLSS